MRLIIQSNYKNVSEWAANYIASKIIKANPSKTKPFVLGLPTGSTPIETYKQLIYLNKKNVLSFKNVITFNMDEYVGLAKNHPQSYHTFMWDNFFNHIDINPENVHILNGMAQDLDLECENYEKLIQQAGGIDLFLGGVGTDGHLAFNEPTSSFNSRTRQKTLTSYTINANSRFFENDINNVPKTALTVGVATVMDAKEVLILVSGQNKARALRHAVEEAINHKWTISALQMHPHGIIVCDEDSCLELTVGTYKYFLDIEKEKLNPINLLKNLEDFKN